MKTITITIIILSIFSFANAQISFGVAHYNKRIIKEVVDTMSNQKAKEATKTVHQMIENSIKNVEYELVFNRNETVFSAVEKLESDVDRTYKLAVIWKIGGGVIYTNLKTMSILKQTTKFGKDFLISNSLISLKWNLENKTKKIGKYLCYKATAISRTGNKKEIVTAWYAPEIPFRFGPAGYVGLPGLIMQLQVGHISMSLTKLDYSAKVKIKKPNKGNKITQQELNELIDKNANNFFDNIFD